MTAEQYITNNKAANIKVYCSNRGGNLFARRGNLPDTFDVREISVATALSQCEPQAVANLFGAGQLPNNLD